MKLNGLLFIIALILWVPIMWGIIRTYIEYRAYKKLCKKPYCTNCYYYKINYDECKKYILTEEFEISGDAVKMPVTEIKETFGSCHKLNANNNCEGFTPLNFIQFYFGVRCPKQDGSRRKLNI